MKNLFNIIISLFSCILLISGTGKAQEEEEPSAYGFLNIVNLIPGDKGCNITLTGKDVVPGGLNPVDSTGWFGVPVGNLSLNLKVEGMEAASGNIEMAENQSLVYVLFLEQVPGVGKDGKPQPPKVRAKRCETFDSKKGWQMAVMSLCPGENAFMLGSKPFLLKPYTGVEVPGWKGEGFQITLNKKTIGSARTETEEGPYYLFIATDHQGRYTALSVTAGKQDLPPWMKKKPKKPSP